MVEGFFLILLFLLKNYGKMEDSCTETRNKVRLGADRKGQNVNNVELWTLENSHSFSD